MSHRLLFMCGSLGPGKDGVGDYTRRLATELRQRGLEVRLLASHDKQSTEVVHTDDMLRIPYGYGHRRRLELLLPFAEGFRPDWLSLQYVPYSFNSKGVPLNFIRLMQRLRRLGKWQVMFHEIWITPLRWSTPKNSAISLVQRGLATSLVQALAPRVCHTHLPYYQSQLATVGVKTCPLPLFPNIAPLAKLAPASPARTFRLGFFSQMDLRREVIEYILHLKAYLSARGRDLEVDLLGGSREKVDRTAEDLRARIGNVDVNAVGFLDAAELSTRLAALDLGITPVHRHTLGKSGTVSAFLTHGVPVAAPVGDTDIPSFFDESLTAAVMSDFSAEKLESVAATARGLDTHAISVAGVADRFLADLSLKVDVATG